jgi:hypothetical protein
MCVNHVSLVNTLTNERKNSVLISCFNHIMYTRTQQNWQSQLVVDSGCCQSNTWLAAGGQHCTLSDWFCCVPMYRVSLNHKSNTKTLFFVFQSVSRSKMVNMNALLQLLRNLKIHHHFKKGHKQSLF